MGVKRIHPPHSDVRRIQQEATYQLGTAVTVGSY